MNRGDEPSRALPVEPGAQPLAALIARVEAATGPDRRLDLDICAALGVLEYGPTARGWTRYPHPELTASLDAALDLVERVLPGWDASVFRMAPDVHWEAGIEPPDCPPDERWRYCGHAGPTPALAILRALLRALLAQPIRHNARDGATPQSNEPST